MLTMTPDEAGKPKEIGLNPKGVPLSPERSTLRSSRTGRAQNEQGLTGILFELNEQAR